MKTFEIEPLKGVGPIHFGMSKSEVHAILGAPDLIDNDREWFLGGFGVDFDAEGTVEFLEFATSSQFRVHFNGASLHELDADVAVALVAEFAQYDANDPELGYTYIFPELQLSLWRPSKPDSDQPADDPDGRHFHAVAIGRDGYFAS